MLFQVLDSFFVVEGSKSIGKFETSLNKFKAIP
jgi:hypothetical protein